MRLQLLLLAVVLGSAAGQVMTGGGHFRSGAIAWHKLEGNEVEFEIQAEWRMSHTGHYKHGSPANSSIFVGDHISIGGEQSPRLLFGDGKFQYIVSEVTAVSAVDDSFRGITRIRHTYDNPKGAAGAPWEAVFVGCCKIPELLNDADLAWRLVALVDLTASAGSAAVRVPGMFTIPELGVSQQPICMLPSDQQGLTGPCFKMHATTLACSNHVSRIGQGLDYSFALSANTVADLANDIPLQTNPALPGVGAGLGVDMGKDGSVRARCALGSCMSRGVHMVRATITDGKITYVRILTPGQNCTAGVLRARCAGCQAAGGAQFLARWLVTNGVVTSIVVDNPGSGYFAMPEIYIETGICLGFTWEGVSLTTDLNVLVRVQPQHTCYLNTPGTPSSDCNPDLANVQYSGTPMPYIVPHGFPGLGSGFDPVRMRGVPAPGGTWSPYAINGGTGLQAAAGHVQAYAGDEVSLSFTATANWCLGLGSGFFLQQFGDDQRCVSPDQSLSVDFGPLPNGTRFDSYQRDAIAELMITYDNPFESHRPGHEWAVARGQRDYAGMPRAEQAVKMGFVRVPQNLNSGVGGASVYLWYRKYDSLRPGDEAITDIRASESADEEARLERDGYEKVEGNLNEQAGGREVHLWYKKSSGGHMWESSRPHADGVDIGITDIAFTNASYPLQFERSLADVNPWANGSQAGPGSEWSRVATDLNAGLGGQEVHLYFRKGTANPFTQRLSWRPCHCDVGRTFMCASARASGPDGLGFGSAGGNVTCVAVDVLPDIAPVVRMPAPEASFDFYMGRETRVPVVVALHNPNKNLSWGSEGLPVGAHLAHTAEDLPALDTACASAPCSHRGRDVVWKPAYNQGGLSARVCVQAETPEVTGCEAPGQARYSEVCFTVRAFRCVYALAREQHLQEIASLFHTDWLNVYSMNPTVTAPDRVMYAEQVLNVGHLYNVVPGDTLSKISTRFGTSIEHLLMVNADVQPDTLFAGDELCVIPDTCSAAVGGIPS